jgi:selenocysteine lyase/cysteine desulfurase
VFNRKLYKNVVPDMPGGGTVTYTNPWGEHCFIDDIEAREDGGTPAFMQTIKAALSIQLKEQVGVDTIWKRENELLELIFNELESVPNLHILAGQHKHRLGVISFYVEKMHFNLGVKLLSDRFGVQVRGGCSCAGTYGHFLLEVNRESSLSIKSKIDTGDNTEKPGWIRMSIHPTTTDAEARFICDAIRQVATHFEEWSLDYDYDKYKNEFFHKTFRPEELALVEEWFD